MSDLVVLALKLLFLALMWLFVLFVGNIIRTDMFGRKVATADAGELATAGQLRRLPRRSGRAAKARRNRKLPTRLRVSRGNQAGLTVPLGDGIKIGRASDCELVLDDDYVSTRHAQIVLGENGFVVEDLGSTNGTYLNNEPVTTTTPFGTTDTLRIGRTLMVVEK